MYIHTYVYEYITYIHMCEYIYMHIYMYACMFIHVCMYTQPHPINDLSLHPGCQISGNCSSRFQEIVLRIIQYKYTNSCAEDQMLQYLILRT